MITSIATLACAPDKAFLLYKLLCIISLPACLLIPAHRDPAHKHLLFRKLVPIVNFFADAITDFLKDLDLRELGPPLLRRKGREDNEGPYPPS